MTLMRKEIFDTPDVLEKSLSCNAGVLDAVAEKINSASAIFIAARGTSDHAAIYAKYVFETLTGKPVGLAAPSVATVYGKQVDYSGSVMIGISQSGEAKDVLCVQQSAKKSGAYTVAITNEESSALAKTADVHVHLCAGQEKSVAATKTFTSQLFALVMIAAACADDKALTEALKALPDEIRRVLELELKIKDTAQRYRFMDSCFTLSRGYDYCMAFEAALKMQECAYIKAKAYSVSDFMHGPIAMIERDTPCLIYLSRGRFSEEMKGVIGRLKEVDADITVVSDDEQLIALADNSIRMPDVCHEILSPLYIAPIIQLFACYTSLTKGLSPDTPRGLKKVTITV